MYLDSDDARNTADPLTSALNDGEDFELLFTMTDENYAALIKMWDMPTHITKIGTVTDSDMIEIVMPDGKINTLTPEGYDHL